MSIAFENDSQTILKTLRPYLAPWPDRQSFPGSNGSAPQGRSLLWGGVAAILTLAALLIAIPAPANSLPTFWPAAGVAAGFILATQNLKRWACGLGVLLALPLARVLQGEWLLTPSLFLAASLAQAILIALILERIGGKPFTLDRVRNVAAFFLAVLAVAAAMGLAVGLGLTWTAYSHDSFAKTWWAYTSANVVGVATVAPALLLLCPYSAPKSKGLTEDIAFAVAVVAASIAVIGGAVPNMSLAMLLALVLVGPLALWAILRATASRAAIGLVIISLVTIWAAGTRGLFADNLVTAQIFLIAASAILLFLGARREAQRMEHPSWLRLPETADQRLAVIIVPLVLFGTMAWWNWRNVEQMAVQDVERITTAVEEHAQRVFNIQEAVLTSALARMRGLAPEAISDSGDVHKFLFDLAQVSNSTLLIADGATGRVLATSREGPLPEQMLSAQQHPEAGGEGSSPHVGEVESIKPTGGAGFSISRRDSANGLVAVSILPVNKFLSLYASPNASEHDALMLIRADGAALAMQPAPPRLIGFQLPKNSFFMRRERGKFKRPHLASSAVDGRERLWQVKKLDGYPVYAIYGYDASNLHAEWLLRVVPFGVLALLASVTLALLVSRIRTRSSGDREGECRSS
ncbi:MAG: MASE1 domain-containing protein [Rhodomicrobium sp.]